VAGVLAGLGDRDLMGAPRAFDLLAVDDLGPVQPLGVRRTIIGHRGRPVPLPKRASVWISRIASRAVVEGGGKLLVD